MMEATATTVVPRRLEHAQRLGVEPDRVELVRLQLSRLAGEGTLVDLDVEGLSRFTRHLSWEELGIEPPPKSAVKFTPGQKGLIPSRYLAPLETAAQQARLALQGLSYDITGFRPYRFVPYTAWPQWTRRFQEAEASFLRGRDALRANYDLVVEEMKEIFQRVAVDAARRYAALGAKLREGWAEDLARRQAAAIPSREEVAALRLTWRPGMLVRESEVEAELLEVARSRAERERLAQEQEERRYQAATETALKEQMRREALARYREELREMALPYQETFHELRARVYEDAMAIAESIGKNGYLRGKTAQRARHMAQTFRLLSFQTDQELERLVQELEALASAPVSRRRKRPLGPIESVLGEIADLTRAAAREVERRSRPSRLAALEV